MDIFFLSDLRGECIDINHREHREHRGRGEEGRGEDEAQPNISESACRRTSASPKTLQDGILTLAAIVDISRKQPWDMPQKIRDSDK